MKLIENSIDSENLRSSISHADLDKEMANCDIEVNGQQGKGESCSGKEVMEDFVKITKLSNGVHKNHNSPTKCNGNINGFYDDVSDDDYHLVLESSSDDGGSPVKKMDEDTISAPQIVQEIEDLLGINASSVGIDDDLEKETSQLDSTESVELNEKGEDAVDNCETTSTIPQEIQDVFEGEESEEKREQTQSQETDKQENILNKSSERIECDSASNMNLVFDEVEIGAECMEAEEASTAPFIATKVLIQDSSEISNLKLSLSDNSHSSEVGCDIESTTVSTSHVTNLDTHKEKENEKPIVKTKIDAETEKIEVAEKVITVLEETDDIPLTQTSNASDSSADWVVIDSVESSDEEPKSQTANDNFKTSSKQPDVDSASKDVNVDVNCTAEELISTSVVMAEGDSSRKRSAPESTQDSELKKLKLEEKENIVESTSHILKRPCVEHLENEAKRTKLNVTKPELEPFVNTSSERHLDKNEKQEQLCETVPKFDSFIKTVDDNSCKETATSSKEVIIKSEQLTSELCDDVSKSKDTVDEDIVNEEDGHKNSVMSSPTGCIKSYVVSDKHANSKNVVSEVLQEPVEGKIQSDEVDSAGKDELESSKSNTDSKKAFDDGCELPLSITESSNNEVSTSDKETEDSLELGSSISTYEESLERPELEPEIDNSNDMCMTVEVANKNKENVEANSRNIDCAKDEALTQTKEKLSELMETSEVKSDPSSEKIVTSTIQIAKPREEVSESFSIDLDKKSKDDYKGHTSMIKGPEKQTKKTEMKGGKQKSIKSPFDLLTKHMQQQKEETKTLNNLDLAIESVVEKAKSNMDRPLPLLKKFHKDQLKKLTRSDLEEAIVLKICEAVTDRSDLGQLRLRCQTLEQNNEVWRKKAMQFEKQNRELEMVLKRFLAEAAHTKREGLNKMALPIKVTRSVGLQVVLASSMHGTLVTSKNRLMPETSQREMSKTSNQQQQQNQQQKQQNEQHHQQQQQQQVIKKRVEKEPIKELSRSTPFTPPAQSPAPNTAPRRGRPAKSQTSSPSTSAHTTPASSPSKAIVSRPSTPVKPSIPTKTIVSPNKDLEVIDLTDKEEKARISPQTPAGGSIRVAPSTQVCFVQQSPPSSAQPMAYLVQKTTRPQFLMAAASTPSPTRPASVVSNRPPPALAVPVFRTGSQIIPVQPAPQVGVRTSNNTVAGPRQMPKGIRVHSPAASRHPAPLPPSPPPLKMGHNTSPPPKPQLKIAKTVNGIMLSWSMALTSDLAEMASYQLYAYQEGAQPPSTSLWKKVGDVKALPLPMACTLTQFIEGHKYHFAVRAVDVHGRIGPFSAASSILLTK